MEIPVSIGEAIDKLSILQIKYDSIKDPTKLTEIKKEKRLIERKVNLYQSQYPLLYAMMVFVNQKIWRLVDETRDKKIIMIDQVEETKMNNTHDGSSNHIIPKPSVIQTSTLALLHKYMDTMKYNDARFRVKAIFNRLCDSLLREQKSFCRKKKNFIHCDDSQHMFPVYIYAALHFDELLITYDEQQVSLHTLDRLQSLCAQLGASVCPNKTIIHQINALVEPETKCKTKESLGADFCDDNHLISDIDRSSLKVILDSNQISESDYFEMAGVLEQCWSLF